MAGGLCYAQLRGVVMARSSRTVTSYGSSGSARIEGLSDFTRALKAASSEAPEEMKTANYDVAKYLTDEATSKAGSLPGVAGKAARSLRASRTASYASIRGGGSRYPYFWGAEFGAKRFAQFQPWRGNRFGGWDGGPGYFLHPTIREKGKQAIDKYMDAVDKITSKAFPD